MPRNTKELILDAFCELMQEKRLEKITVKDIVERSGVSRKTFYCYFADVFDLIAALTELRLDAYVGVSDDRIPPRDYIKNLLLFFMEERKFILQTVYGTSHLIELLRIFLRKAEEALTRMLDETKVLSEMPKADAETFVRALTCAVLITGLEVELKDEEDVNRELERLMKVFKVDLN